MLASLTVFYLPAKTLPKSSLTSNGVALPVRRAAPAIPCHPRSPRARCNVLPDVVHVCHLVPSRPTDAQQQPLAQPGRPGGPQVVASLPLSLSLLPDGHSPPPTPASGRSHAACSPLTPLSSPCAQGRSDSVRTSTQNLPRRSSVSTSDYQARHARRRCGPTRSAIEMRSRRSASASGLSRPRRSPGRIVTGEDVITG